MDWELYLTGLGLVCDCMVMTMYELSCVGGHCLDCLMALGLVWVSHYTNPACLSQSKLSTSHYISQTADYTTELQTHSCCFHLLYLPHLTSPGWPSLALSPLTSSLNNQTLPSPQAESLTRLACPNREHIEFLSRRDNRSKLVAASLWAGPILTIIVQLLVLVLSGNNHCRSRIKS